MKMKVTFLALLLCAVVISGFGQMKVVIMGSSTAYGVGASTYENSWAGRIESYLNRNSSDGEDTLFYNISFPGYDTYQEMPSDFIPPANRPSPDIDFNVTKAVSFNPDIVIISLPSNDISYGYAKIEMMNNLRTMSAYITSQSSARCYVATPQPRNDFDQDYRDSLLQLVDSINNTFGPYAVDFWSPLVTDDGLSMLRDEFRNGSLHLNDDGHNELFKVLRDGYIFGLNGPVSLRLTGFSAQLQTNKVVLQWRTEQQEANARFEVQRSIDGAHFVTFTSQDVPDARASATYTAIDNSSLSGKTFYRLKIVESQRVSYSSVVTVMPSIKTLDISKLFVSGALLIVELKLDKPQQAQIQLIGMNGAVNKSISRDIGQTSGSFTIPLTQLAAGQYYFKVSLSDGSSVVKAFVKP